MQHSHTHAHDDDHDHSHEGHGHAHGRGHGHTANERSVGLAALLTGGFMVAEIVGGLLAGSLALLADAGHMLTDFASLSLAWIGFRLTRQPADWRRTYGFDRFAVLVAFVNGIALFAIAVWIVTEAAQRLYAPIEVRGAPMLWIAAAGLGVNVLSFYVLRSGDRDNLNIRAAVLHVIGDLLGSVVVALIILRSAWRVVADSSHILLEGSPPHIDSRALREQLRAALPFVLDVHHVHAWSISQERPMVTLHASIASTTDSGVAVREIKQLLATQFRITHATIEIEYDACGDGPQQPAC